MKVKDLIKNLEIIEIKNIKKGDFEKLCVKKICNNSKSNVKNSLFVCIRGLNFDSHTLCGELYKKGVKIFVCEEELNVNVPYILVKSTRSALSFLCDNFYKNPILNMKLICVVGTNGKTTTTYFIQKILENLGVKVGVIGTSGVFIDKKKIKETLTTPDPEILNKLFF